MKDSLTALVLTYNEAPNISRTLERLEWVHEVVVLDSFSSDETLEICRRFPNVRVEQRRFDTFAGQCNHGLGLVRTPWVLSLDADYVLTEELIEELKALPAEGRTQGYRVGFTYCVFGWALRASLYPARVVLYRKDLARYRDEGHGHRVEVDGEFGELRGRIRHDDRKPLSRWLGEQQRYMQREVAHLSDSPLADLGRADRIRRWIVAAPPLVLLYTLFFRLLILDGWPGLFYVLQRVYAELLLSLMLLERKLESKSKER